MTTYDLLLASIYLYMVSLLLEKTFVYILVPLLLASIYLYMVSLLLDKKPLYIFWSPIAGKYVFVFGLLIDEHKTFVYILVPLLLASVYLYIFS